MLDDGDTIVEGAKLAVELSAVTLQVSPLQEGGSDCCDGKQKSDAQ